MPLRKYMHPKNKYKIPPNFKELAKLYPEFHNNVVTDLSGKLRFNFKNEQSLRVLAKTLLKHDFDLDVNIPPGKLVPALPLRLNYIHWIEDLMEHGKIITIQGIDIGTGAICIYPLLCAKINGWKMIATEIDPTSVTTAAENIHKNQLNHLITVISVDKTTILKDIKNRDSYAFTMCNPPFFNADKSDQIVKNTPPRNAKTGNDNELLVDGGEIAFVKQMINESILLTEQITIYTTMLGQKSSLAVCRNELKNKNIVNTTWTEFCQGHTKRWGLAWSFCSRDRFDLTTAPVIRTRNDAAAIKAKEAYSSVLIFPRPKEFPNITDLIIALKQWIHELKIEINELKVKNKDFNGYDYQLRSYEDTWSHARRKRRMAMRLDSLESKKLRIENNNKDDEAILPHCSSDIIVEKPNELFLEFDLIVGDLEESVSEKIKICLIYHDGAGGRNAIETFRQYLINKLGIRDYIQQQNKQIDSMETSKKRKKKKKKLKTYKL